MTDLPIDVLARAAGLVGDRWSILIVALDVVIIYALAVHGREARAYDA